MHYQQVALTLDAQGGLSGKVHEEHGGYAGADARQELTSLGEKKYLAELAAPHSGWTVPKLTVAERENVAKPLALDYEFTPARRRQRHRRHALPEPAARVQQPSKTPSGTTTALFPGRLRRRPGRNH